MLRDFLLFVLCCLLGLYFVTSQGQRQRVQAAERQEFLYQLGAPDMLEESAQKSLLEGDYLGGLKQDPDPNTFTALAELFLAGDGQDKVPALAFTPELLGRVRKNRLEFFSRTGDPQQVKMFELGEEVKVSEQPLREVDPPFQLKAEGAWLLFRDQRGSLAFRVGSQKLNGYSSPDRLAVEGDSLVHEQHRWVYRDGGLEMEK